MKKSKRQKEKLLYNYQNQLMKLIKELDISTVAIIVNKLFSIHKKKGTVYIMGNGGSAALASHFALDLRHNICDDRHKVPLVKSLSNNITRITAIANDYGYKYIFKEQLLGVLKSKDAIIVISGSGNSLNIIEAVKYAGRVKAFSIGFLGFDGGKTKTMVDIAVHVKSTNYTLIENTHMFICVLITNSFRKYLSM